MSNLEKKNKHFVCNGCEKRSRSSCKYKRQMYIAKKAQADYESLLVEARTGIPHEKPHVEKNHTLFRDIVPSGTSFDNFTQEHVNLIFSHVNAVKRKQFNGKSAYDMFAFSHSVELATALGISFITPKNVVQTPVLLKKFFS